MTTKRYTASDLRANVYRVLDSVLESGVPVEIERKGRVLKIVPEVATSKLSRLVERPYLRGDSEEIVHLDWSRDWRP
jgi:antitoxin (DNA-binding transcriptional repressor) of toxin-antitoxin stability system